MLEKYKPASRPNVTISEDAMRLLVDYHWPGNVRELQNCMECALTMGSGPLIRPGDIAIGMQPQTGRTPVAEVPRVEQRPPDPAASTISAGSLFSQDAPVIPWAECEKRAILGALRKAHGDRILAARMLGIGKTTVYRKLKEYGAEKE
jgi:two-component system response regulator HydG